MAVNHPSVTAALIQQHVGFFRCIETSRRLFVKKLNLNMETGSVASSQTKAASIRNRNQGWMEGAQFRTTTVRVRVTKIPSSTRLRKNLKSSSRKRTQTFCSADDHKPTNIRWIPSRTRTRAEPGYRFGTEEAQGCNGRKPVLRFNKSGYKLKAGSLTEKIWIWIKFFQEIQRKYKNLFQTGCKVLSNQFKLV